MQLQMIKGGMDFSAGGTAGNMSLDSAVSLKSLCVQFLTFILGKGGFRYSGSVLCSLESN